MIFDLSLVHNRSDLGLVAGSNHIYLNHVTAVIILSFFINIINSIILSLDLLSALINLLKKNLIYLRLFVRIQFYVSTF